MTNDDIAKKILHVLEIYPIISHTMLQVSLGPQLPARTWRPVLDNLIEAGKVTTDTIGAKSPSGRHITYTRIQLPA